MNDLLVWILLAAIGLPFLAGVVLAIWGLWSDKPTDEGNGSRQSDRFPLLKTVREPLK